MIARYYFQIFAEMETDPAVALQRVSVVCLVYFAVGLVFGGCVFLKVGTIIQRT